MNFFANLFGGHPYKFFLAGLAHVSDGLHDLCRRDGGWAAELNKMINKITKTNLS